MKFREIKKEIEKNQVQVQTFENTVLRDPTFFMIEVRKKRKSKNKL
jgi:hypothetical protein